MLGQEIVVKSQSNQKYNSVFLNFFSQTLQGVTDKIVENGKRKRDRERERESVVQTISFGRRPNH